MDDTARTELEAAAFRRLLEHLRQRSEVQNIDLMNSRRLLPQLSVELVSGSRGGARA